jgi:hypothetical protein
MGTDDEAIEVHAGADHRGAEGAPGGRDGARAVPQARDQRGDVLRLAVEVRGGRSVSDARKLKGLEDENARLKKLLAESMLDVSMLRAMLAKNF